MGANENLQVLSIFISAVVMEGVRTGTAFLAVNPWDMRLIYSQGAPFPIEFNNAE